MSWLCSDFSDFSVLRAARVLRMRRMRWQLLATNIVAKILGEHARIAWSNYDGPYNYNKRQHEHKHAKSTVLNCIVALLISYE